MLDKWSKRAFASAAAVCALSGAYHIGKKQESENAQAWADAACMIHKDQAIRDGGLEPEGMIQYRALVSKGVCEFIGHDAQTKKFAIYARPMWDKNKADVVGRGLTGAASAASAVGVPVPEASAP